MIGLDDAFVWRALAAGLGVAVVAAPLGCFVVWRRMAYFGDTLSHSALMGVALGVVAGVDPMLGVLLAALASGVLLVAMQRFGEFAGDTILGILAHSTLALGVVVLSLVESVRVDLFAYLFGDILAVLEADLAWIAGGAALVLAALVALWRPLLSITVHPDLAQVEGVPVLAVRLAFVLLLAIVVAVAMRIVGILLITSLLVIPPATARRLARTPVQMAVIATGAAAVAVIAGLAASLGWDLPAGPSMVVAAAVLFLGVLAATPSRV
ncbi:MAG: metal ABC transporter permease [Halofilum sp. (in: g-proteobacteria)]|nr:metal ABC transporter permease [Halofilum sp. (in: g-proteobacteria)]